jgi:hypothetical protein
MDRDSKLILRQLVAQWDEVKAALQKMNSSAAVRPDNGWSVFEEVTSPSEELVSFNLRPVVFNLPERANHSSTDLFVAVEGRLTFRRDEFCRKSHLVTHDFFTRAGYFRQTQEGVQHIYGAHYDLSRDELGHPVFHAQMKSFCNLLTNVREYYELGDNVEDCIEGMLKTVRLPTAQMDIFSFFLQICADHLLYSASGKEEREAFNVLLERNTFLQGAGFQFDRLGTESASSCYRARHWYPA